LVGKFITFETAAEYADLLKRNGYREAQVVAWLGKKEIPIETARHLFDNLK
jgi:sulfur carrier protein ThiS